MLFANLISVNTACHGYVPIYCYRQLNPSTMQWMLGLFTKARLTQRSLFKSIYNILKVIFSLNKRLRDMTLFSLLVFSNGETADLANRTPGWNFASEVAACGLFAGGREGVQPQKGSWGHEQPVPGRTGVVRCQNQGTQTGRQHLVTTNHVTSHTPHVGTMPSSVSCFLSVHTSSFCNEM